MRFLYLTTQDYIAIDAMMLCNGRLHCITAVILLSFVEVGLYIYRYLLMKETTALFKATKGNAYMKFQLIEFWSEMYTYIVGIITFFTIIKLIKLLRFNRKISFLTETLSQSGRELALFGIMWGIVFFSFVQYFHLILLRDMFQFATFISAFETSMAMMLGRFDFQGMTSSNDYSPFFFILFMIVNMFILMNMGLSILIDGFTIIKNDAQKLGNEHEIVDFVINKFKLWTGQ